MVESQTLSLQMKKYLPSRFGAAKSKIKIIFEAQQRQNKNQCLLETLNQVRKRSCCIDVMGSLLIIVLADFEKIHLCQGSPEHKHGLGGNGLKQPWEEGLGGVG